MACITNIKPGGSGSYTVTTHRHGIAVEGSVPIDELDALSRVWAERGLEVLDYGISDHFGVTLVVCTREGSKKWRAEIEAARGPMPAELAERVDWYLHGWDKGVSSKTILAALSGRRGIIKRPGVPHDADDVGRCVRLLELFPEWRGRLGEVGEAFPEWAPWAARWEDVEALYCNDVPALNRLCDELNGVRR